ncbi:MAG: TcpQ domain-containing protein, partial [Alphaproteobacteria bacterium]|nr:TcpQ domain-containing protein [Alphaproteobacteria bacterium]
DALDHWAKDADVKVVWESKDTFPLPETIKTKGSFEEAVTQVLKQYAGQEVHPTAQLNTDPKTGERALIITTGK